jgi:uncharacterized protein
VPDRPDVVRNEEADRFEIGTDDGLSTLAYIEGDGQLVLVHTEVPESAEGKGYGSALARAALDYARSASLKVVPRCRFVQAYIARHPEYAELVG